MDNSKIMVGILTVGNHFVLKHCIESCKFYGIPEENILISINKDEKLENIFVKKIILGENKGVSFGWNVLIKEFMKDDSKDVLFVCNDDILFLEGWYNCADLLMMDEVGLVSPFLIEPGHINNSDSLIDLYGKRYINNCLFGAFGLKKKTIEKIGFFDEKYLCYGEDSDYRYKIFDYSQKNKDALIMVTDLHCYVLHLKSQTTSRIQNEVDFMSRNSQKIFEENFPNEIKMDNYNETFNLFLENIKGIKND